MSSLKEIKLAARSVTEQKSLVAELNMLVKDIERCEKTIRQLKAELEEINARHQGPRSTREDVEYLTGLLACAKNKLNWEKQLASLQKRTPLALEHMSRLLNDAKNPPGDDMRAQLLKAVQGIQAAMERLQTSAG